MSVAVSPSDTANSTAAASLAGIRAKGGVRIAFDAETARGTVLRDLHEWGGFRAKLPRTEHLTEAVLINTGGGLLGGDNVQFRVDVAANASAQIVTQSAERIYKSLGPDCEIEIHLTLGAAAKLHWLPQETILFDRARLARTISADIAADATLLMVEATVIGRAASAETVTSAALLDRWRIRRGGTLVYADTVRLAGDLQAHLSRAAIANGATALATVLYIAPDAEDRRDTVRCALDAPQGRIESRLGISAWNGMLLARLLAPSADALKADIAVLVRCLSRQPLPRVWGHL
jgi:urease accessory protein